MVHNSSVRPTKALMSVSEYAFPPMQIVSVGTVLHMHCSALWAVQNAFEFFRCAAKNQNLLKFPKYCTLYSPQEFNRKWGPRGVKSFGQSSIVISSVCLKIFHLTKWIDHSSTNLCLVRPQRWGFLSFPLAWECYLGSLYSEQRLLFCVYPLHNKLQVHWSCAGTAAAFS